jgi:hypothetical protein
MYYAPPGIIGRFPSIYTQLAKEHNGRNKTIAMMQHLPIFMIFLCPTQQPQVSLCFLKIVPL